MNQENINQSFLFLTNKNKGKSVFYISMLAFLIFIGVYSAKIDERDGGTTYLIFGLIASIFGFFNSIVTFLFGKAKRDRLPGLLLISLFLCQLDLMLSALLLLLQSTTIAIILCIITIVGFGIMVWEYKSILSPPPVLVATGMTEVIEESSIPLDE
jgi:hypothetical protein